MDYTNLKDIEFRLKNLKTESLPIFGEFTAQHMVEHLIFVLGFSNGRNFQQAVYPAEKLAKFKSYLIDTDMEMTVGFKSPVLPAEGLPNLIFEDLETAKSKLLQELEFTLNFWKENPNATPTNPVLGELNESEWEIFHNKHFSHHFKQFQL